MSDGFPDAVIGKHAYVVLSVNPEQVAGCKRGTIVFDAPYKPGVDIQHVINVQTGAVSWCYVTCWLFRVRAGHTVEMLYSARDRALAADAAERN